MKFTQLDQDNQFARRIDEHDLIAWDNTHLCKAENLTLTEAMTFRVVSVAQTDLPYYDPVTQGIRETNPVDLGGSWTQTWEVYPLPLADQQANQKSLVLTDIRNLEVQVTGRRIREALVSGDTSFIADIEAKISILRALI